MKKTTLIWILSLLILVLLLVLIGSFFISPNLSRSPSPASPPSFSDGQIVEIVITDSQSRAIKTQRPVVLSVSPAAITQGLSGQTTMPAEGMLFLLSQSKVHTFWMKEMNFPLDMIWFSQNTIVHLTSNALAPDPTTPLSQLPLYTSQVPVDKVLEVTAGTIQELHLQVGDKLTIK